MLEIFVKFWFHCALVDPFMCEVWNLLHVNGKLCVQNLIWTWWKMCVWKELLCLSWVENSFSSKHYIDYCKPWRGLKVDFQEINEGTNERLVFDWCVNGLLQLNVTTTWCWESKELCDSRICILFSLCGVKVWTILEFAFVIRHLFMEGKEQKKPIPFLNLYL